MTVTPSSASSNDDHSNAPDEPAAAERAVRIAESSIELPAKRSVQIASLSIEEEEDNTHLNYMTVDVRPDIEHYRRQGVSVKHRPSISTLMHGRNDASALEKGTDDNAGEQESEPSTKFGWIEGVYVRCMQNIIGVILFVRIAWVGAQCGLLLGSVVILLASGITFITALSLSAICTNGEMKGGGLYYLISRTLGPEFGGSIGIMFSVANAIAVVCLLLTAVIFIGISFESFLQKIMLIPLFVAIIGFWVGSFLPVSEDQAHKGMTGYMWSTFTANLLPRFIDGHNFFTCFAIYFPSATGIMAGANISGDLKQPQYAIPKGTILAIASSTAIYLSILLISGFVFVRNADGVGLASALSPPQCEIDGSPCPFGSYHYFQVMATISVWRPLVVIGLITTTMSSALISMVSAPKILQAVCSDHLFPVLDPLAKEYGSDRAPRRAYAFASLITVLMVVIGDLNQIAPIISNFFLGAYLLVNYSCFDASFSGSPGFRPAFKFYSKWVSLLGAVLCVIVMFTMNWITALVTFLIFSLIFLYLKYSKPDVNWGSSMIANRYRQTLYGIHRLTKDEDHVKNYRPQILVLSSPGRRDLTVFAHSITRGQSLLVQATIHSERLSVRAEQMHGERESRYLRTEGLRAFAFEYNTDEGLDRGARTLMQCVGLGKLVPNIVMMGFKRNWIPRAGERVKNENLAEINEYFSVIQIALERQLGVAIVRNERVGTTEVEKRRDTKLRRLSSSFGNSIKRALATPRIHAATQDVDEEASDKDDHIPGRAYYPRVKRGTVDVWWLSDDGGLTLLVSHLLTLPKSYLAGAHLRIFTLSHDGKSEESEAAMAGLLAKFRIDFASLNVVRELDTEPSDSIKTEFDSLVEPFRTVVEEDEAGLITDGLLKATAAKSMKTLGLAELLREKSKDSDLVVMTLPVPRKGSISSSLYLCWLEMLSRGLPPTLLVRGNQTDVLTFYS